MNSLVLDLRYAWRLLTRHRTFTLVALATLAIGVGATTALFTVANAVLLRPLPYAEPERLVLVRADAPGAPARAALSGAEVADLRDAARLFESVAALVAVNGDLTSRAGDAPMERVSAASATDNLLPLLGIRPAAGRLLDVRTDMGADRVLAVLISHDLWVRRYGADPALVGRQIEVNNLTVSVAGVLPPGFKLFLGADANVPARIDVWFPTRLETDRGTRGYVVIARLAAGVTLPQARAELEALSGRITTAYPQVYAGAPLRLQAAGLQDDAARAVRPALLALLGAVGFVLLIACANVANLLLARTAARSRELAVRAAVGAGRGRLVRQLLTEGLVLGIGGGLLGLLVAQWAEPALNWLRPAAVPAVDATLDRAVLLFALLITLAASVLFSLAPALQGLRGDVRDALRAGGRTGAVPTRRLRTALVVAEVALSVVLLSGAGLMLRTVTALGRVDTGFEPANVLTLRASMRPREFGEFDRKWQFYREALQRVRALPGVQAVGAIRPLPLEGLEMRERVIAEGAGDREIVAASHTALPGYFDSMGIRMIQGRDFEPADMDARRAVAVIDEGFARAVWPGLDPIGRRVSVVRGNRAGPPLEVVGVVSHVRTRGLRDDGEPQLYLPYHRNALFDMAVTIRASGNPMALAAAARAEIESLGGKRPVFAVRLMREYVGDAMAESRFVLILLGVFAVTAVALAGVGLYGVVAYTTAQRTRDIGIRVALGAGRADVLRLVFREGLGAAAGGILLGLGAAGVLTRYLETLLFGVDPADPATLVGVAIALAVVAMLAVYGPARRAARIPASDALRSE
jgi:putative ABC transport system permease protein